jgi:hypothetical protein
MQWHWNTSDDLTKQVIMAAEPFKDRGGLKPQDMEVWI